VTLLKRRKRVLPASAGEDGQILLREWRIEDAGALSALVAANVEHLRPWMAWASRPVPSVEERELQIASFAAERARGGDAVYGIFVNGEPAGSCGLHHRLGPDALEIGYWVAAAFTRRGVASSAARILTDAAFAIEDIAYVEIHHDRGNVASGAVPRRLGYTLMAEVPGKISAPAETGVECQWRVTRRQWDALRAR